MSRFFHPFRYNSKGDEILLNMFLNMLLKRACSVFQSHRHGGKKNQSTWNGSEAKGVDGSSLKPRCPNVVR